MAGTRDVNDVEVALLDDPIEMNVDKIQPWCRAPVPQKPWLDMLALERLFKQGVVVKIDLTD
jgi:hypothetical protein